MKLTNLFLAFGLLAASASAAPIFTFATIPANGFVSAAPGATVGYGYILTNPDPTLWLLTTSVSAGTFANATATSLFDFPILSPGESVTVPFDSIAGMGLYQIDLDPMSPIGYMNVGSFVVSADFYSGNPFDGGVFQSSAADQVAFYRVTALAATASVPEPLTAWTLGVGLVAMCLVGRRRGFVSTCR